MNAKITAALILLLGLVAFGYWHAGRARWFDLATVTAMDSSFQVARWKGFSIGAAVERPINMKETLTGEFASDSPAFAMLMDDKNFQRLRLGYPPLAAAKFGPGKVRAEAPGGKTWLVFFQDPGSRRPDPFPATGLQLGLQLLKRLQEQTAPPARVTVHLAATFSAYLSPSDAAALRAKFRNALASARQRAQPLPGRTLPAPPSQALKLRLPIAGKSFPLAPGPSGFVPPAGGPKPAEPSPAPPRDPQR